MLCVYITYTKAMISSKMRLINKKICVNFVIIIPYSDTVHVPDK